MEKTVLYTESRAKAGKFFVIDKNSNIIEISLKERMLIGRKLDGSEADILLDSSIVSRRHGELVAYHGEYFYRDLGSANGTTINGTLYKKSSSGTTLVHKLMDGDILRVDSSSTEDSHPDCVQMVFSTDYPEEIQWNTQHLTGEICEIKIGRSIKGSENMQFENLMVSNNHASFFLARQGWAIADHNSTNGVFVNGVKISSPIYLKKFDVIRIVNLYFIFLEDRILYQKPAKQKSKGLSEQKGQDSAERKKQEPIEDKNQDAESGSSDTEQLVIQIVERSVWNRFKKKTLLQNINITVNNGEMVMILGGSGAGKTTFMNAVMGYEKAQGQIFHGERDIYNDFNEMKFEIGYVPQQDLMRGADTVFDTLSNAAKMKLPRKIKDEERRERIDAVLELLGLSREKNSLVKKLSGGQRKRLSVAIEYIADPVLFFLDEPDSGLDGIMAKSLNESLRTIADEGKIVMVITHSPDRVASLYDKVIVLAKSVEDDSGHLTFYGSVDEALAFFETGSLEGVVKRINRKDEGGDGKSDYYIQKYKECAAR